MTSPNTIVAVDASRPSLRLREQPDAQHMLGPSFAPMTLADWVGWQGAVEFDELKPPMVSHDCTVDGVPCCAVLSSTDDSGLVGHPKEPVLGFWVEHDAWTRTGADVAWLLLMLPKHVRSADLLALGFESASGAH